MSTRKVIIPQHLKNVSFILESRNQEVSILMRNPGIIPEDKMGKLFNLDHKRRDFTSGGIGSAFAARAFQIMGGKVSFRNYHDQETGTPMVEFIVTFPAVTAEAQKLAKDEAMTAKELEGLIENGFIRPLVDDYESSGPGLLKVPIGELYQRLFDRLNQVVDQVGAGNVARDLNEMRPDRTQRGLGYIREHIYGWQKTKRISRENRRMLIRYLINKLSLDEEQANKLRELDFWYTEFQKALREVLKIRGRGGVGQVASVLDTSYTKVYGWAYPHQNSEPSEPSAVDSQRVADYLVSQPSSKAMVSMGKDKYGGIDLNSANLAMMIKRDGRGVVLPLAQQDLAQLSDIEGLDPEIISIRPASQTPEFAQLQTSP